MPLIEIADDTEMHRHTGMCDASAAVAVDPDHFLAANDETNDLNLYHARRDGPPLRQWNLSNFLRTEQEADLEASVRVGRRVYWITSHGSDSKGRGRPQRCRFFATDLHGTGDDVALAPVWTPCTTLYEALADKKGPLRQVCDLKAVEEQAPKHGGLSIEGLAAGPDGSLLIGLRSPVVRRDARDYAVVVPLLNPDQTIEGAEPRLDAGTLLNLGGLGIRSLEDLGRNTYLVLAGPVGAGGPYTLFRWRGPGTVPELLERLDFGPGAAPEGLIYYEGSGEMQVLLDEGNREEGGRPCKKLTDISARSFRSAWIGRILNASPQA